MSQTWQRGFQTTSKIFVSLLVFVGLFSLTGTIALAQDPGNGKMLWEKSSCQKCHGAAGEGLWSKPLAGSDKTAAEWITQVRTPRKRMPSYTATQVSDQAITDMHAYLITLTKPATFTPRMADLPGTAHPGQKLIADKLCVACHTTSGPLKGFLARSETPTVAAVMKQLRTPHEKMPAYSVEQVSDEQAQLITEFLVKQVASKTGSPATLPTSGGANASVLWWALLSGVGLLSILAGVGLRWLVRYPSR